MEYTINANRFFRIQHWLKVSDAGVVYINTAVEKARRVFTFGQIGCVLLSDKKMLSFQVDEEVFEIPMKPEDEEHQNTIRHLLAGIERARSADMVEIPA